VFIIGVLKNHKIKFIIYAMINLKPEICRKIRDARREAGLSQKVVADEIGCKQPALSMFESGDGTKLNDEFIEKLAEKFGININEDEKQIACDIVSVPREKNTAYCPNHQCPSHEPYFVGSERFLRPNRIVQDPVGGKFCAICGELLETRCPNCGAAINDGAVCSCCGKKYVAI
jgi:transcriptional regulator with XRE-family HTH domain